MGIENKFDEENLEKLKKFEAKLEEVADHPELAKRYFAKLHKDNPELASQAYSILQLKMFCHEEELFSMKQLQEYLRDKYGVKPSCVIIKL